MAYEVTCAQVSNSFMRLSWLRIALLALPLLMLVLLASCNSPVTCLPKEMTEQIVGHTPPGGAEDEVASVAIYLDVSTSMKGYVTPANKRGADNRKLPGLIRDLPSIATQTSSDSIHYYFIGSSIREVKGKTFMGQAGYEGAYDDSATNLVEVLERIQKSDEKELSVLVTDLIPHTKDDVTGSGARLWKLMGAVVKEGRCLALLGVRASFVGNLDFPPDQKVSNFEGDRPLFVVVIGSDAAVRKFTQALKEWTFKGMDPENLKVLIASKRWSVRFLDIDKNWASSPSIKRHKVRPVMESVLEPELRNQVLEEVITGDNAALEVSLPLPKLYPTEHVEFQPSARDLSTTLWSDHSERLRQTECVNNWWRESPDLDLRVARLTKSGNVIMFTDKRLLERLTKGRTYALEVRVFVKPPSEESIPSWLKKDNNWSCDPADLPRLKANRPDFFPTLNLESLGKVLVREVGQAVKQQDIARIRVVFVVE